MTAAVERLLGRGYTPREASFIELAALQSGYFVRSQFNDFASSTCGAVAQTFIEKAIKLEHVTGTKHLGSRVLYHFSSCAVFAALGDPNNRNRRLHQNETIRRRLMALDYCIAEKASEYVLTEKDKVHLFTAAGVPETDLPAEVFARKARRYFVDRQPVTRDLRLAYIDEGFSGLSPWENFLTKHRRLLQQLPEAMCVFASPEERRFLEAGRLFREIVTGSNTAGALDAARLRKYFEARQLFEARDFGWFTQTRLDQLREDRIVFAGEQIESIYAKWKSVGDEALAGLRTQPERLAFRVLKHRYDWLSPIRKGIFDAAHSSAREKGKGGCNGQAGQGGR